MGLKDEYEEIAPSPRENCDLLIDIFASSIQAPSFLAVEKIKQFFLLGQGIHIAPAIGSEFLSNPMEMEKLGNPLAKFVVPSIGSITHTNSLILSAI